MNKRRTLILILSLVLLCSVLVSCSSDRYICYYGFFEDSAYAFVLDSKDNTFYSVRLPLEQILLWGKASGLDSIPVAMRNYVGLKESGFLLGSSGTLLAMRDLLDAMGSDSDSARVNTMVDKASILGRKPIAEKISLLCGQDSEQLFALLAQHRPESYSYDAHSLFNSDDLNFSQRYFTQWLEQVLGGNK